MSPHLLGLLGAVAVSTVAGVIVIWLLEVLGTKRPLAIALGFGVALYLGMLLGAHW